MVILHLERLVAKTFREWGANHYISAGKHIFGTFQVFCGIDQ